MKTEKNVKDAAYNPAYSVPLTEAQKSVAKGLYIPLALRDKIKHKEDQIIKRGK